MTTLGQNLVIQRLQQLFKVPNPKEMQMTYPIRFFRVLRREGGGVLVVVVVVVSRRVNHNHSQSVSHSQLPTTLVLDSQVGSQ